MVYDELFQPRALTNQVQLIITFFAQLICRCTDMTESDISDEEQDSMWLAYIDENKGWYNVSTHSYDLK